MLRSYRLAPCGALLFSLIALICSGQTTAPPTVLTQVASVFSGSETVGSVTLTGTAHWFAGSLQDSGSATLTASSTGAATMQLDLATKGSWTEAQSAIGTGMTCNWVGADSVVHQGDMMNCNRPVVWFLPVISLQPTIIPSGIGVLDLGIGAVDTGTYRNVQIDSAFSTTPAAFQLRATQSSITDIAFDPASLLPSALNYQVHPDTGDAVLIPIEIRYSNYQRVSGVELPFTIQRYVNGSLQLEIAITNGTVN